MCTLPKTIYKFNAIPIKSSNGIFRIKRTNNLKICMEQQKAPILRKKKKAGGFTHLDFLNDISKV